MLVSGLYEQVINKGLIEELYKTSDKQTRTAPIDSEEASKILSKYIGDILTKAFDYIKDNGGDIRNQINLANKLVTTVINETHKLDYNSLYVDERAEQLLAVLDKRNSIYGLIEKQEIVRPVTSIAQSSLFTGATHEPQMFTELKKEIISSNRIDMLVSFIKWSGLRLIMDELQLFTKNGGKLRVITTSYMGATDVKAIDELQKMQNTEIKISYDTKRTRLHAKAYVFYRDTGFSTAYIGSSNLSNTAISSGLEWNVKVTKQDLPDTINKITATFESYWNANEFERYSEAQRIRLEQALKAERYTDLEDNHIHAFDITPYPYQHEILDKLQAEREVRGNYNNLIVAATGTGKTVISALDYKNFCKKRSGKHTRLLFVAHREEILKQSVSCFRGVLKDSNFGSLFVGSYKPDSIDYLFISIQTFNSQNFTDYTTQDFYDYIIIDEFHHAAAPTYQNLLTYYKPKVLLGLTATPERMDGKSILSYFNNRIAAEIRLPEAIDRKLLCPFQYFGVTDEVNLDELKWSRGGYDKNELSKIYTFNSIVARKRANLIIASVLKYVTDINSVKGLGFCVSKEHAQFMSDYFNEFKIPSIYLISESSDDDRNTAKKRLISGEIRFIFVVDLYNEGIDIPEVNTILFLRPTESLTVFLQQLGRGLRLSEDKECLTVLDFIGQANKKYNFQNKFEALLSKSTKSITYEIKNSFISVPKGCYIQLEKKAREYILENIKASFGEKAGLLSRIASFTEDTEKPLKLENFVDYYHLDIRTIYSRNSFSRLCVLARVKENFSEEIENTITKAFARICAIDSRRWLSFMLDILPKVEKLNMDSFTDIQVRMLQMFHFTVWQKPYEECGFDSLLDGLKQIKKCPVLFAELIELLQYNFNHIDFIDENIDLGFDCPLDLHCKYTRDQIFVALDYMKPSVIRQGVKWLPEKKLDVFINTLNKTEKDYSPTTMYNDYSINEWLFHWQSQSTTSEDSITGQRYINHKQQGSKVLLFVREYNTDIAGTAPFTFLGTANYVSHEGSCPMNIIWKLDKPIPAKFITKTNKLVVG